LFLDEKYFSNEQIEFLDKFFKDNPWADNAQIDSIVKQTGLTESIIKVKSPPPPPPPNTTLFFF